MRERQMAERKKERCFTKMRPWKTDRETARPIPSLSLRDLCETLACFAIKGFFIAFKFATASSASPAVL
jgi:hypothetical protein